GRRGPYVFLQFRLQRLQLLGRLATALAGGGGQSVGAVAVECCLFPRLGLTATACNVLLAIEKGRVQLPVGPASEVVQIVGRAAGIWVHEQATLRAAAAFAHTSVVLEAVRTNSEADRKKIPVAQAHAHRAEGGRAPIGLREGLIVIVVARGLAMPASELNRGGTPRLRRLTPAAIPPIGQGGHRPLSHGGCRGQALSALARALGPLRVPDRRSRVVKQRRCRLPG